MIKRLGFSGRLIVIVLLVLFAAVALGTGSSFVARSRNTGMSPRLPLPDQAAAIVALLDKASPEQRVTALRAVNTELLSVAIVDQRPSFGDRRERMAAVEWLVGQYLETLGDREVIAAIETLPGGSGWQDRLNQLRIGQSWLFSPTPLRIAVALDGGGYVVFETRGAIGPRFLGLPAGFGIGVLGALLGLIALLAVIREARPIEALSRSMRRFADDATPKPMVPVGAPDMRALIVATNTMQTRIANLLKGRTILFGAISHDLKTFLTRLRLRIEAIDDDAARGKAERDIEDMVALIEDALSVARSGEESPPSGQADLAELLRRDLEARPGAAIRLSLPEQHPCRVQPADPLALSRVIANLIDNALRYGARCNVAVTTEPEHLTLSVDDAGPGIPPAERETVFEPFHRLEHSRNRETGGSGLGLAITRQIVERHGGTIRITDSLMGGARFEVRLPSPVLSASAYRAPSLRPSR